MIEELENINILGNINSQMNEIYFALEIIKYSNKISNSQKLYLIDKYKSKNYILTIPEKCLLNTSNILVNERIKYMNIVISRLKIYGLKINIILTN